MSIFLKNKLITRIKRFLSQEPSPIMAAPKFELSSEHIAQTRMLVNRKNLLQLLPSNGIVAELGVDEGDFSKMILAYCKPKKLHLVDYWGTERYGQNKKEKVVKRFHREIIAQKLAINIGLSTEVVQQFKDGYFDWIYIDTDHSYETTIKELELYRPKIKSNGIIAGHDFIIGNWEGKVKYGVIEAVYEFCVKYDWEIIYLTSEIIGHPSFAIKKIGAK